MGVSKPVRRKKTQPKRPRGRKTKAKRSAGDTNDRLVIAPSLLGADFGKIASEIGRANRAGVDWLHLDIMDGHFVPNISFGPAMVKTVRPMTKCFFDVHFMCVRPEILLDPFQKAGADQMTVHVELGDRVAGLIWKIKSMGLKVGLAVNPPTALSHVERYLHQIDLLLVMTVNPGFGGQPFIEEVLTKIQRAARWRSEKNLDFRIQVDGGIDADRAAECAMAGADTFVSGTGLFGKRQMGLAVRRMRQRVASAWKKGGFDG